jgi:hypothetical protein
MNRQPTDISQARGTGRMDKMMRDPNEQSNIEQRKTLQQHFRLVEVLEKIPLFRELSMHQFKQILKIFM